MSFKTAGAALLFYAAALFLIGQFRPWFQRPPVTAAEARMLLPGEWSGSEGWGQFTSGIEIIFHPDSTYTVRTQGWNKRWHERSGTYSVDLVSDTASGTVRCAASLSTAIGGGVWYFRGGNVLYNSRGSGNVSKNMGWVDVLIWYIGFPVLGALGGMYFFLKPRKNRFRAGGQSEVHDI